MEYIVTKRNHKICITLFSKTEIIEPAVSHIIDDVTGMSENAAFALSLALTEALTNAIVHGNKNNPGKKVFTKILIRPDKVVLRVADEGKGFDHETLQDPTRKENLLKQTGSGIYFIRHFMDEVKFNTTGNEITMVKYLN